MTTQRRSRAPTEPSRIILVDPSSTTRELLARRLRVQGYVVEEASDPAAGANMALGSPPAAVVADLWMPSISGVQLCRLLRSEPATAEVPVILCGDADDPRNRFWADRAGANAYVPKHRTGELVRVTASTVDSFFFQMGEGTIDVRDRIARHLDEALFDAVIAAEVRALAACGAFERLFDLFAQFLSQVLRYRWLAITTETPSHFAVHHSPGAAEHVDREASAALGLGANSEALHEIFRIEDADAAASVDVTEPLVRSISLGSTRIGRVALSPYSAADAEEAGRLLSLVARELGGPIRMTALVEESQRLASTDALTGLHNRRAFSASMVDEIHRAHRHGRPMSLILLDLDHFKKINDGRGHAAGDRVLAAIGLLLRGPELRRADMSARWGGEEFVVGYVGAGIEGATVAAERLREAITKLVVLDDHQEPIPISASIGLAELRPNETLDSLVARADRAMYVSKTCGRNRVSVADVAATEFPPPPARSVALAH
jgi:two-component system cell cycle response regulator